MFKFPSINQFRNVIRHVKDNSQYVGKDENGDAIFDQTLPLPKLAFVGTVKLHGTNAGIAYNVKTGEFEYQSRERNLTLLSDNAGFMLHMSTCKDHLQRFFDTVAVDQVSDISHLVLFGEWCGEGIQKGVGVNQLPKMFVPFAIRAILETKNGDDSEMFWIPLSNYAQDLESYNHRIYPITKFKSFKIEIDFAAPEEAQNKMIEITNDVEAECPVAAYFGIPNGVGEGVVWTCVTPGYADSGSWMKIKGEKHSSSKVRTLAPVDVQAANNFRELVENVVTESRLNQGLDNLQREQLKPFEMSSLGDFIRWIYNDILKEEADTIVASGIDTKKLGSAVASKARLWYISQYNLVEC